MACFGMSKTFDQNWSYTADKVKYCHFGQIRGFNLPTIQSHMRFNVCHLSAKQNLNTWAATISNTCTCLCISAIKGILLHHKLPDILSNLYVCTSYCRFHKDLNKTQQVMLLINIFPVQAIGTF